jgi:hypothetical protein
MADRKLSDLTALTAPDSLDEFLVLDADASTDADKNKRVTFGTLCSQVPVGSVTAPSLGFAGDSDATGFFRSAANEIAISTNDTLNSKFTTTGLQIGTGTATAQFHTFKTTTGDDVVIENSDGDAAEGPNVVLYRNSATPAADDILGTLEFRGEDAGSDTQSYAEITAGIVGTAVGSEDGRIDFKTTKSGASYNAVRLQNGKVGINETAPEAPVHINSTDTQILRLECPNNDAASGADITFYRHKGDAIGAVNDELSTLFFRGHNTDATESQRQIDYAAIQAQIADPTVDGEDGRIAFQVQAAGTLTTQLEIKADKIEFFQDIDLASGKEFKINGASVLNATTLGSSVVSSSLTSVGTIGTGTWNGTAIGVTYGGTGLTTAPLNAQILLGVGGGYELKTLTAGTNVSIDVDTNNVVISASGTGGSTNTAGDGIDIVSNEISVDLKANGGLVIESTELALDLGATAITGTLPVSKLTSVTATATELNLLDGDTAATATTLAATDRIVVNDDGTMVQVALSDLVTFLENGAASNLDIDGGTY